MTAAACRRAEALAVLGDLGRRGFRFRSIAGRLQLRAPHGENAPAAMAALATVAAGASALVVERQAAGRCTACGSLQAHDLTGAPRCPGCDRLPPGFGAHCAPRPASLDVNVEVERIAPAALACGWTHADLWNAAGWLSARGLAAVMQAGSAIVDIDAERAVIRTRFGGRLVYRRRGRPAAPGGAAR